ncbi:hypothetical protein D6C95_03943 [Aureobasidium pullulans]|nr:hypothetical protein D6C95_03943 [Aureobasidium pullulans]
MADNMISASKARPSIETEDSSSFTSQTNTSVKAEHVSSASIPTTPVSPSFKLQMCEIDLSEYQSDGTYQKPVQIQLQYRSNDTILLNELTCEFNRGHHVAALESYKHLAKHVVSMIKGNNANCACALCTGPSRVLEVSGGTPGHSEQE